MLIEYIKLNPVETHKIGKTGINPPNLAKLITLGVQDPQISHDVFMALLKELSMPGRYVDLHYTGSPQLTFTF